MIRKIALDIPGAYEFEPVAGMPGGGLNNAQSVLQWATTMIMIIAVITATVFLIWGGIEWISSGGSKEKIEAGRKRIIYSILGLVLIFSSYFIITIVSDIFGVNFF